MDNRPGESGPHASSGAITEDADPEFEALLRGVAAAPAMASTGFAIGPGDEIGGYQIVERIGQGGMGVVFRAIDPKLDRTVAIKLLRGAADPVQTQRLVREARTMAQLNHANVVTVLDVGTHDGAVFIAMEYINGTLRDWLAAQQRPWREILAVFMQAARGLTAAHELGITHRDFKPENVLLDPEGRARVADFGLAIASDAESTQRTATDPATSHVGSSLLESPGFSSQADRLTRTNTTIGTPAYMAPEQYDETEITSAADQFAFCVSLYEALYGVRPFLGETPSELLSAVMRGEIQTPPENDVPRSVLGVLTRGLKSRPEQRFATMAALTAALPHARTRARRHWVVGGILLTGGLGAGMWGLVADKHPMCADAQAQLAPAWNVDRQAAIQESHPRSWIWRWCTGSCIAHKTRSWPTSERCGRWKPLATRPVASSPRCSFARPSPI
ncbi:MAG: serine/threonine protein kinase [Nannocystaceae bacterium]|nr:serine/threonine protein kinase [Nannocystaceae bacterium]